MLVAAVAVLVIMATVCLANPIPYDHYVPRLLHLPRTRRGKTPIQEYEPRKLENQSQAESVKKWRGRERCRAYVRQSRDACLGMMSQIQGSMEDIKYNYDLLPTEYSHADEMTTQNAQEARELKQLWEMSRDEIVAIRTMADSFMSLAEFIESYGIMPDDTDQLMFDVRMFHSGVEKMRDILSVRAKRAFALRKSVVGIGGDVQTK